MKISNKVTSGTIGTLFLALIGVTGLSSCGTVGSALSGGKRPSFLVNAPKDVVVKLNGEKLDISSELFATGGIGNVDKSYYTAAVNIPFKNPVSIQVSSASEGKSSTLDLKPKGSTAIFFGNLIFAPIVGHLIDAVTKNNKILEPKYIDVASVLNNVPLKDWPSQGKLKRLSKKDASKNTTKTTVYN